METLCTSSIIISAENWKWVFWASRPVLEKKIPVSHSNEQRIFSAKEAYDFRASWVGLLSFKTQKWISYKAVLSMEKIKIISQAYFNLFIFCASLYLDLFGFLGGKHRWNLLYWQWSPVWHLLSYFETFQPYLWRLEPFSFHDYVR